MGRGDRRKCKCCLKLFHPDPRNRRHQCYCSARACRAASKTASQARWLAKPENQSYFRGAVNVARVRAWRSRHPGYWRKGRRAGPALQDVSMAQPIGPPIETANPAWSPLQDVLTAQPAVLIGFLQRLAGAAPVFNPRYLDFARHHGFAIEACNVARGTEKGAWSQVWATSKRISFMGSS